MRRLVCVGEGHGELEAVPRLCEAVRRYVGAEDWRIDPEIVRLKRPDFVGAAVGKQKGTTRCNPRGIARAVELARRRPSGADAVIFLCDADDDCAADWAKSLGAVATHGVATAGVMAVREYESWLLWNIEESVRHAHGLVDPEAKRDAKKAMRRIVGSYSPTTHQLKFTRELDVPRVRARSKSFDKFVRSLATLFGVEPPPRPAAAVAPTRPGRRRRD